MELMAMQLSTAGTWYLQDLGQFQDGSILKLRRQLQNLKNQKKNIYLKKKQLNSFYKEMKLE